MLDATSQLPELRDAARARGLGGPLSCLTQARTGILFGALGAARDCLATALDYAAEREVFGRPLAGYQLTQAKFADMATAWNSAYLLALHVGRATDAGTSTPADGVDGQAELHPDGASPSPASAAPSSARTGSPASTRCCGTRPTWRAC